MKLMHHTRSSISHGGVEEAYWKLHKHFMILVKLNIQRYEYYERESSISWVVLHINSHHKHHHNHVGDTFYLQRRTISIDRWWSNNAGKETPPTLSGKGQHILPEYLSGYHYLLQKIEHPHKKSIAFEHVEIQILRTALTHRLPFCWLLGTRAVARGRWGPRGLPPETGDASCCVYLVWCHNINAHLYKIIISRMCSRCETPKKKHVCSASPSRWGSDCDVVFVSSCKISQQPFKQPQRLGTFGVPFMMFLPNEPNPYRTC